MTVDTLRSTYDDGVQRYSDNMQVHRTELTRTLGTDYTGSPVSKLSCGLFSFLLIEMSVVTVIEGSIQSSSRWKPYLSFSAFRFFKGISPIC